MNLNLKSFQKEWDEKFDELFPYRIPETLNEIIPPTAIYNMNLRRVLKAFCHESNQALIEKLAGEIEKMEKQQLDKDDPDNYGACYAIGGFNDALNKILSLLQEPQDKFCANENCDGFGIERAQGGHIHNPQDPKE